MAQASYNKTQARRFIKRTLSGLGKLYYGDHISGKMMVELSTKFSNLEKKLK